MDLNKYKQSSLIEDHLTFENIRFMSDPHNDKIVADKRYSKSASVAFLSSYRDRWLRKRENSAACDIRTTRNFPYALDNGRSLCGTRNGTECLPFNPPRDYNQVSKSLRQYLSNIPGKHEIKELQKTAILGTANILREVLM